MARVFPFILKTKHKILHVKRVWAKLENSVEKQFAQLSIDRKLDSIDEARADCFSAKVSNSAQTRLTCRILCFVLSIKGKTLTTF